MAVCQGDTFRHCGTIPDTRDHRDKLKIYDRVQIRRNRFDLGEHVCDIYDQGELKTCTVNAVCAAYALNLKKQSATEHFMPSRMFVHYNSCRYIENRGECDSVTIFGAINALKQMGVCEEKIWPYKEENLRNKPTNICYDKAKSNTLCQYDYLKQDIGQLRACLDEECPFIFGFKMYDGFKGIDDSGVMPAVEWDRLEAGHAVVAVGYDDTAKHIKVLNSWGSDWGDKGYFYMPYDLITNEKLCFDFWRFTYSCTKDTPSPPHTDSPRSPRRRRPAPYYVKDSQRY